MFKRYAIFYTAPDGPLATFGAAWLGWDSRAGVAVPHPAVAGLDVAALSATPRKYGFHGTLKAPFALADGVDEAAMIAGLHAFVATQPPARLEGWYLADLHGFLALRPLGETAAPDGLAAAIVRGLDHFRAPVSDAYVARRRLSDLSPRQDQQMLDWGYPYIFDDFRFHLTLTGRLDPDQARDTMAVLEPLIAPVVPKPDVIEAVSLMGEAEDGMFHELHRVSLMG